MSARPELVTRPVIASVRAATRPMPAMGNLVGGSGRGLRCEDEPMRALPILTTVLVLGACSSQALRPAPTPPGEVGPWGVAFTATLPAGFWEEGTGGYRLVLECPEPVGTVGSAVTTLRVSSEAEVLGGDVFLKADGPGTGILSPADLTEINPAQVTIPAITLVGLTDSQVDEVSGGCTGSFVVDGGETTPSSRASRSDREGYPAGRAVSQAYRSGSR